jgi:hypothetical protein
VQAATGRKVPIPAVQDGQQASLFAAEGRASPDGQKIDAESDYYLVSVREADISASPINSLIAWAMPNG